MKLPLRPWIYKNIVIIASIIGVLYVHFQLPSFAGFGRDLIQDHLFDYLVPGIAGLIIFGGTGLFALSNLKHYRLISCLFSIPLTLAVIIYTLDPQFLYFIWLFFLALLAQTLDLFIILSTRKKPSANLILTLIFLIISGMLTQLCVDFEIDLKNAQYDQYTTGSFK